MSRSISQPFTDNASQRAFGAGFIVHAKGDTRIVAEIKLGKVAVKVLFRTVLINAFHAALEN